MTMPLRSRYAGHRFPPEIISPAIWLYFRFPLSLRMVEEMLAARGVLVSHATVRQWALKFGQAFANQIRRRLPRAGDKWHLDEVVITIAGQKHGLWRAGGAASPALSALVAGGRPGWPRARRAGAEPTRPAGGQAPAAPAAEEAGPTASGADHRQAGELSGGEERADARGRAPPAQGPQQPSREFPPADPAARTADEAVQIRRSAAAVPLGP